MRLITILNPKLFKSNFNLFNLPKLRENNCSKTGGKNYISACLILILNRLIDLNIKKKNNYS